MLGSMPPRRAYFLEVRFTQERESGVTNLVLSTNGCVSGSWTAKGEEGEPSQIHGNSIGGKEGTIPWSSCLRNGFWPETPGYMGLAQMLEAEVDA